MKLQELSPLAEAMADPEGIPEGFVRGDSVPDDCFIVDPGKFDIRDKKVEEKLIAAGYKIENDTGMNFYRSFQYVQDRIDSFFISAPQVPYVSEIVIPRLREFAAEAGKEFTLTQLKAFNQKWMQIVYSVRP